NPIRFLPHLIGCLFKRIKDRQFKTLSYQFLNGSIYQVSRVIFTKGQCRHRIGHHLGALLVEWLNLEIVPDKTDMPLDRKSTRLGKECRAGVGGAHSD